MKPSTGRLLVIFLDAVTRKICIFFCPSFVAVASSRRRRNDLEAATRQRCVANFLVALITNRKVRSSFATVVFFPPRTLTPLTGDKYFLFWFFKTFLWEYRGFDARKFLLNLFFANYILIRFSDKIIFYILNFSLLFIKLSYNFGFQCILVNGNTMNIIHWDFVKSKSPTSSLL